MKYIRYMIKSYLNKKYDWVKKTQSKQVGLGFLKVSLTQFFFMNLCLFSFYSFCWTFKSRVLLTILRSPCHIIIFPSVSESKLYRVHVFPLNLKTPCKVAWVITSSTWLHAYPANSPNPDSLSSLLEKFNVT